MRLRKGCGHRIAMANRNRWTRHAASMIRWTTILQHCGREEGRNIYSNIRKFIRYLLSCNVGEVLTMFLTMLMGLPIPLLPAQVLAVNLATDGLPAIALGMEPGDPDTMERPPRSPDESIFSFGLARMILVRGVFIAVLQ